MGSQYEIGDRFTADDLVGQRIGISCERCPAFTDLFQYCFALGLIPRFGISENGVYDVLMSSIVQRSHVPLGKKFN